MSDEKHQLIGSLEFEIAHTWRVLMDEHTDGRYHALARTHFEMALYWLHMSVDGQKMESPWDGVPTVHNMRQVLVPISEEGMRNLQRRFKEPRTRPEPSGYAAGTGGQGWQYLCRETDGGCGRSWIGKIPAPDDMVKCRECGHLFNARPSDYGHERRD